MLTLSTKDMAKGVSCVNSFLQLFCRKPARSFRHSELAHTSGHPADAFSSMNFVQFLISLSSMVSQHWRRGEIRRDVEVSQPFAHMAVGHDVALAFSSFAFTGSGMPLGPNRPNQNRNSRPPFHPSLAWWEPPASAGDRAMLVTARP